MNNKLKRLILATFLILIGAITSFAQLNVKVNISSHPDPYISNWPNLQNTIIVTVTNSGKKSIEAKFDCKVNRNGVLQAYTKPESMQILEIPPGVSQYYADDLVPFTAIKVTGGAERTVIMSGMLPAGDYEFCTSLIDPKTNAELTPPVCKNFTLVSYQAPVLLVPLDGSALSKANRLPMLRWSGLTPKYPSPVTYRIVVFEVMEGQTPITAFRVNRPIMDKEVVGVTQMLWPTDFDPPQEGMQYIWSVQALNDLGKPITEGDQGWAKPFTFNVPVVTIGKLSGDTLANQGADLDSAKFAPKIQILIPQSGGGPKSITPVPTLNVCCGTSPTISWHTIMDPGCWPPHPTGPGSPNYSWTITGLPCLLSGTYTGSPVTWNWAQVPVNGSSPSHTDHSETISCSNCLTTPGVYNCTLTITRSGQLTTTESIPFVINVYPIISNANATIIPNQICYGEAAVATLAVNPSNAQVNWEFDDPPGTWHPWWSVNSVNTNAIEPIGCAYPQGQVTRTYRATVDPTQWGLPPIPPVACPNFAEVPITIYCPTNPGTLDITSLDNHTIQFIVPSFVKICSDWDNNGPEPSDYPITVQLQWTPGVGTVQNWTVTGTPPACPTPISGTPSVVNGYLINCPGTYTFTVNIKNGLCNQESKVLTVIVADPPPVPVINVFAINDIPASGGCPFDVCPHDDAKIKVANWSSMPPNTKYQWYYNPNVALDPCNNFPGSWIMAGQGYEQNTNEIGPLFSNWINVWWMVTVQDANSVCDPVKSSCCLINIIKPPCKPVISIIGPNPKCPGASVTLNSTISTGSACGSVVSYQWYWNGNPITSATSTSITVTDPGTYYVIAIGTCESTKSDPVIVQDHQVVVTIQGDCCPIPGTTNNICATGTSTCPGNGTYLWSTGATTSCISVTATVTTIYSVIYTDACGCKATTDFTVTVCQ